MFENGAGRPATYMSALVFELLSMRTSRVESFRSDFRSSRYRRVGKRSRDDFKLM